MLETILFSVGGAHGNNKHGDVTTIQDLLNRVPVFQGGPTKLIDDEGIMNDETAHAISHFQMHHFKSASGEIKPGGKTFLKLILLAKKPQNTVSESGDYLGAFGDSPYKR